MRKIKILLADDNDKLLDIIEGYFDNEPEFEVVGKVNDGVECLEAINDNDVDLLVLDMIMPKLDGIAVLDELNKKESKPKVLVFTACGQENIVQKIFELGVDYYIVKPFEVSVLIERIKQIYDGFGLEKFGVGCILEKLFIPQNTKGYVYLAQAIKYAKEDPELLRSLSLSLYSKVASEHGTKAENVERAIRNSISLGFERGEKEVYKDVFRYSNSKGNKKPTNSEFINTIVNFGNR